MSHTHHTPEHLLNEAITVPEVRLLSHDAKWLGVYPTGEALTKARDLGLDLVLISPRGSPPIARMMNYARYVEISRELCDCAVCEAESEKTG